MITSEAEIIRTIHLNHSEFPLEIRARDIGDTRIQVDNELSTIEIEGAEVVYNVRFKNKFFDRLTANNAYFPTSDDNRGLGISIPMVAGRPSGSQTPKTYMTFYWPGWQEKQHRWYMHIQENKCILLKITGLL